MKGTVIFVHRNSESGDPDYCIIRGDDGKEYFAPMGDTGGNEKILYEAKNKNSLEKNESVKCDSIKIRNPKFNNH